MSRAYKNLLIALVPQADTTPQPTAAARAGMALAGHWGAHVTVIHLAPRPAWVPHSVFTEMPARLVAAENRHLSDLAQRSLDSAAELAADAGVECRTLAIAADFYGLVERGVRKARLQDLVVMDAASSGLPDYREIVHGMLFRGGRPVLLVPTGWTPAVPGHVTVAWDGSVPSARALFEALAILQAATQVDIVTIQGEKKLHEPATGDEIVAQLARHDIRAQRQHLKSPDGDVAAALRGYAAGSGSQLIVMGAYAHSRFQEAILGGVTRSMLDETPVAVLMAH